MRIKSLKISNILSFQYVADISNAEELLFEDGLNIIIGENGAGKSTTLEVLNFLFKRVIYKQYTINNDLYSRKSTITSDEKKQTLLPPANETFSGFRLDPNWDSEKEAQRIRLVIELDDIDLQNIQQIENIREKIRPIQLLFSSHNLATNSGNHQQYVFDIELFKENSRFTASLNSGAQDLGYDYLVNYNFYKELIFLYNLENTTSPIDPLRESFSLISSYRNYHSFSASVSLKDQTPERQIEKIRNQDFSKSLNSGDQSEPSIFSLVRLRVAERHFGLISQRLDASECEQQANEQPFIKSINSKLKIVHLECKIRLIDLRTWQYSFEFHDTRRGRMLSDINQLSAGQKAIIHLVFEAYGKGDLKVGLVIIDEPEIHLHYQFQHEYLQVIKDLNKDQKCQYVLVTHSEALINSSTISHVKRFSLDENGYTRIKAPQLTTSQKSLIKILDNTRSTYAFFSKTVLLVEGDTDRYFFKSVLQEQYPQFEQEIAVLYMGGKNNYPEWRALFSSFGLKVYFIADFDFIINKFYPSEKGKSLKDQSSISAFKTRNTDWESKIDSEYANGIFILKNGDLEHYLNIAHKGLPETIDFCKNRLSDYLKDDTNFESKEVRSIIQKIIS